MGDKRCCIHNQDAAQFLYMSRLEDDEDDAGNRYHDKRFVDHAGSYLVAVAGAYEVDGTDDGEQGNETQVQYLMVGNLRIIKEFAVVDEFAEVALFTYNSRAAQIWWQQNQSKCVQFANLSVWYLDDEQLAKVSAFADRTMTLQATIQDGVIWLSDDKNNLEVNLTAWQQPS